MLSQPRSVVASGDIDGLVSATMLASVTKSWDVVASSMQSRQWLVHPFLTSTGSPGPDLFAGQAEKHPGDLFGVDLFSVQFDNVSNHVVEYGTEKLQNPEVRAAFNDWDEAVRDAATTRLLAVPGIWANPPGGQESLDTPTSSRYKYPFGTAQILLAMLESSGHPPRALRQNVPTLACRELRRWRLDVQQVRGVRSGLVASRGLRFRARIALPSRSTHWSNPCACMIFSTRSIA